MATTEELEKANILIVDDQENNLIAMRDTLQELDTNIYLAHSGVEALKLVTEHEFAVVLLDMYMPEMDGFETAELMRKNKYTEHTPIVFVTAVSKEKIQELKGYRAGAVDYMFKPIDPYILKSKVQIFLNIFYQRTQRVGHILRELSDIKAALNKSNRALAEIEKYDPITELPNRRQFENEVKNFLEYARTHQAVIAVLYVNINNWKLINDICGYQCGDQLLKLFAKKCLAFLKQNGFMAYLGEDKFAIALCRINNFNEAGKTAAAIDALFQKPIEIQDEKFTIRLSIGIACYPLGGNSVSDLMKNAEIAMFRARLQEGSNWFFFNKELYDQYKHRLMIEKSLRTAIEKNEFYLVYQVIYHLKSKQPSGIETLLRWKHPTLGHISPVDFIPIAEDTGLIQQIGKWVIDQSCQQFSKWSEMGFNNMRMSINLSPKELQRGDLISLIMPALSAIKSQSNYIELELSESAIMEHTYGASTLLKKLHDIGLKICIDNFGTSYSSLSILKDLAIDTLKIDRTFVKELQLDPNVRVIVRAIIGLANGLNLRVVAEGIETQEQLNLLINEGCDEGQGFILGNPVSAQEVSKIFTGSTKHVE